MLFNSIEYFLFLPIIFFTYWFIFNRHQKAQTFFLLIASYFFYGFWDYRFLGLIFLSTNLDFFLAQLIFKEKKITRKKLLLNISLFFNLGLLGVFKYFNFFSESFSALIKIITSTSPSFITLNLILPVGISFYTFQTLSYTIDVYRGTLKPTKDFIGFSTYVAFFPQLVAGPIERASNLLPQILEKKKFSYRQGIEGTKLIIWGLFKKIVIADNLSIYVDQIFELNSQYDSWTYFLGAFFFSIQIYCDFSGYSDIAIGTSKLLGYELMSNFKFPYFSRSISEFWKRWHISLSSWFRDYLYIPLGGSRTGKLRSIRNVFIIFLVSGFWHGANWTFILWGGLHALIFIPSFLNKNKQRKTKTASSLKYIIQICSTFLLVTLFWIPFRSESIHHTFEYIKRMIFSFNLEYSSFLKNIKLLSEGTHIVEMCFLIIGFILLEFLTRKDERNIFSNIKYSYLIYYSLIVLILFYSSPNENFIYFQF